MQENWRLKLSASMAFIIELKTSSCSFSRRTLKVAATASMSIRIGSVEGGTAAALELEPVSELDLMLESLVVTSTSMSLDEFVSVGRGKAKLSFSSCELRKTCPHILTTDEYTPLDTAWVIIS